jgi:hypothetical protein
VVLAAALSDIVAVERNHFLFNELIVSAEPRGRQGACAV